MGKTKKEPSPLWVVLTQGSLLMLGIYFLGLLGLSALLTSGRVGEGNRFPILASLMLAASFFGGLAVVRRTPWGTVISGIVTAGVFLCALAIAGFALWESISFTGQGGILICCGICGGAFAGIVGKPRKKKRSMVHR